MKEERNVNIDLNNSVIAREYITYLERKDARKRLSRKDFWFRFQNAVCYMLIGAGISSLIILASIGFDVVL